MRKGLRRKPLEPRAWQRMLSGRRLDLLDPSPLDIEIEDVAHGLARVARWNGQTRGDHAFSAAQHSLIVEAIVARRAPDPRWRLAALLHDGPAVDAIALCTPPQVRYDLAAQALGRGIHMFLEKPPGATLAEVGALQAQADKVGVSLFAAWHSRFAAGVAPARAWLAERKIQSVSIVWREDVRV